MKMDELKPIVTLIAVIFFGVVAYMYNSQGEVAPSPAPATSLSLSPSPSAAPAVNRSAQGKSNKVNGIKFLNKTNCDSSSCKSNVVKLAKSLPFVIEHIVLNNAFKDNHRLVKIEAGVTGGNRMEWAATSIAIAEIASRTGADSIEVLLNRNEISSDQSMMFRQLSNVYYAPNQKKSIWGNAIKSKWEIYVAKEKNIATKRDIEINNFFDKTNQKLIDSGVDYDKADEKAGIITVNKFHLKNDWMLFSGNLNESEDGVERQSIRIVHNGKDDSLKALNECLSDANATANSCKKS
ncbi:hypothetical protein [Sodalis sp. dw_96]|uniref:hypothetical protein n=1 Tax=Sodalis sp. dw_96 TaxID=2719794 RepID=UPI001BD22CF1|nr:hypothetical protein [Sodalis sp. dw_96]